MKREELIKKWLDNELNSQEFEAFKALNDYEDLVKLSDSMQHFKAPEYNTSAELNRVLEAIESNEKTLSSLSWTKQILRVAAVIALLFSVYYYTTTLDTTIETLMAEKTTLTLPDASEVILNASSTITYNKKDWTNEREISLEGEAYFRVAKGEKFSVETDAGIVSVLGTQFNVKHRDDIFEVVCYEGAVSVQYENESNVLKPGDSFLIIDGKYIAKEKEIASNPSWINNESYFKSMPLNHVLRELERQYNITIATENVNLEQYFTGSFVHNNKELALKSITLPLSLKYRLIDNSRIVITRE